ncbi:MAG: tRNA (adenosine(37)-N6)-threonylcarbamoyltransferase complex ATPase subunit type 1 TsaE [Acidobacteriota bacterium]
MFNTKTKSYSPEETFTLAEKLGETLKGGEIILLSGELGAGKTLFTKGVLHALNYDIDEVTSPSFTLVNLYKTEKFDVFHIDFWRLNEKADVAQAVGLDEILEDETAIVIMEWSEKLRRKPFSGKIIEIKIEGDGDEPRMITVSAA